MSLEITVSKSVVTILTMLLICVLSNRHIFQMTRRKEITVSVITASKMNMSIHLLPLIHYGSVFLTELFSIIYILAVNEDSIVVYAFNRLFLAIALLSWVIYHALEFYHALEVQEQQQQQNNPNNKSNSKNTRTIVFFCITITFNIVALIVTFIAYITTDETLWIIALCIFTVMFCAHILVNAYKFHAKLLSLALAASPATTKQQSNQQTNTNNNIQQSRKNLMAVRIKHMLMSISIVLVAVVPVIAFVIVLICFRLVWDSHSEADNIIKLSGSLVTKLYLMVGAIIVFLGSALNQAQYYFCCGLCHTKLVGLIQAKEATTNAANNDISHTNTVEADLVVGVAAA